MRRKTKKYNRGGLLRGKSHAQGGMPAIIGGQEPVELEGGEYIIRKNSVKKYGEGTIARINQGLVDPNKLRQLEHGGSVNRRNNMATRNNRSRRMMPRRRTGYGRGGRVSGRRRFQQGGHAHSVSNPGAYNSPVQHVHGLVSTHGGNHTHGIMASGNGTTGPQGGGSWNTPTTGRIVNGIIPEYSQPWNINGQGTHGHTTGNQVMSGNGNGGMRMQTERGPILPNGGRAVSSSGPKLGLVPNPATGKFENGGMVNSCPPGQHMMPNGTCMNDSDMPGRRANPNMRTSTGGGGYRRGGRIPRIRKR